MGRNSLEYITKYNLMNPWMTKYQSAKTRCLPHGVYGKRGLKCLLTPEDVKFLWFRDKAYELKSPSIDRIDGDGNYELKNCRFIELTDNLARRRRPVRQYSLSGKLIAKYSSQLEAYKLTGIPSSSICAVINGRQKTSFGFIWK